MPADYQWVTDEDARPEESAEIKDRRQPPWRRILLASLVVVAVLLFAVWQVRREINAAEEAARAAVLASHGLVEAAAAGEDSAVLRNFLSGRDDAWSADQVALVEAGRLFSLSSFGLERVGQPYVAKDTRFSPELTSAELDVIRFYGAPAGAGMTETVRLEQTLVYRFGGDRWLFSPPDQEFWGPANVFRGSQFAVFHRQKDDTFARALLDLLEQKMPEVCRMLAELTCPSQETVQVRLEVDNRTLLSLADTRTLLEAGSRVVLPSPSAAAGRGVEPEDDELLVRAYASMVMSAVITDLVDWECCRQSLFYQAALDGQLAALGLRPWPLGADEYLDLLLALSLPEDVGRRWRAPAGLSELAGEWQGVYALTEFLLWRTPEISAVSLQRGLSLAESFDDWLALFLPEEGLALTREAWVRFLSERGRVGERASLYRPPNQDVLLLCEGPPGSATTELRRFNPLAHNWTLEGSVAEVLYGAALADGSGVVLQQHTDDGPRTVLWRSGEVRVLYSAASHLGGSMPELSFAGLVAPGDRALLMARSGQTERVELRPETPQFYVLPLDDCLPFQCAVNPLPGFPHWSPDGQQMIILDESGFSEAGFGTRLLRVDAHGRPEADLGYGFRPFWIDNHTYGYLKDEMTLVKADIVDDRPSTLLSAADLVEATDGKRPPGAVSSLIPIETASGALLVLASWSTDAGPINYLFKVDANSGDTGTLLPFRQADESAPVVSPGGRFAVFSSLPAGYAVDAETGDVEAPFLLLGVDVGLPIVSSDGRYGVFGVLPARYAASTWPNAFYLVDLETGELLEVARYGGLARPLLEWSTDGRWWLRLTDGLLDMIAPEARLGEDHAHHLIVGHPYQGCSRGFWVQR